MHDLRTRTTEHLPDELHVPTSPDDVVQPNFVLPTEFEASESVPLGRGEPVSVGDGHGAEQFVQGDVNQPLVEAVLARHESGRGRRFFQLKMHTDIL